MSRQADPKQVNLHRRHFLFNAAAISSCLLVKPLFAQELEPTWARVKRTGRLRLGAIGTAFPYFKKDLATDKWQGFMASFGEDLAQFLGVQLEWVETTWGNAVLDLQTNRIDAQLGLTVTPQRQQIVNFSLPLFHNLFTVVARPGFFVERWEQLNHPNIKIAVDMGSSHDQLATRLLPNATILRFENSAAATLALQVGRADCQILVVLLSTALVMAQPKVGQILYPTPNETAVTNIGMRKQSDPRFINAVNQWIEGLRSSNKIKQTILLNMQELAGIPVSKFPPQLRF